MPLAHDAGVIIAGTGEKSRDTGGQSAFKSVEVALGI